MKKFLREYRYELIAAVGGAVVMMLELVGARMVAPFFGTSIYVWTAMIGVVLGALSYGYWYGGILADRGANDRGLMRILLIAAGAIYLSVVVQEAVLSTIAEMGIDVRIATLIAATGLFAPAALLLGVVSPYVAKLRVSSLKTSGQSIGRLYAAGTFGSIIGTFLAGYWLIGWFGNRTLGFSLVLILIALSLFAERRDWIVQRLIIGALALLGVIAPFSLPFGVIADIDSAYSRYIVKDTQEDSPRRFLVMDPFGIQSAQYIDDPDELALKYTERFMRVLHGVQPDSALVIGGGAFTFPRAIAAAYPEISVDTVEIDPRLSEIARQYFHFEPNENSKVYNEDGRVFLNRAPHARYEMVFLDAFSSLTPPYQLTTREATAAVKRTMTSDGVAVANVIASYDDSYGRAMAATYRRVFAHVDIYPVHTSYKKEQRQNLIVVMTDNIKLRERARTALGTQAITMRSGMILTDDFAPVEQLIQQ
jgi:spermidine synthase